jgi:hypothetical protein
MGKRLSVEVMTKRYNCGEVVGGRGSKFAVTDYAIIPSSKILKLKWRSKPAKLVKSMSGAEKRVKSRGYGRGAITPASAFLTIA